MTDEKDILEARSKVREAFDEVAANIIDGQRSLTARMVRAYRAGALESAQVEMIWNALSKVQADAIQTYNAAIAQPAPKVSMKSRITL